MWMPLGRPNWNHWSMKLPSASKIWMRLFWRSATNSRPWESSSREWISSNSPGPIPFRPQVLMNRPRLSNFMIRALPTSVPPPLCPSAT